MSAELRDPYCLVPEPAEIILGAGEFLPGVDDRVLAGSAEALRTVDTAWPDLTRREEPLPPLTLFLGPLDPPAHPTFLVAPPRPEAYALALCPDGVTLVGHDEAGLFYGLQTLRQIFAQRAGARAWRSATGPGTPGGASRSTWAGRWSRWTPSSATWT